jgi:nicotinate-nucleotide adenylyltransferase
VSGLLHDICKEMPRDDLLKILKGSAIMSDKTIAATPGVWHGWAGALFIPKDLGIYHAGILNAVRYHSTGSSEMTLLEKILYIADLISADRHFPGVESLREKAYRCLDEAVFDALGFMILSLGQKQRPIVQDTLDAYNRFAVCGFAQTPNKDKEASKTKP